MIYILFSILLFDILGNGQYGFLSTVKMLNSVSSTLLVKAAKIESNLSQITTIEEKNSKKGIIL